MPQIEECLLLFALGSLERVSRRRGEHDDAEERKQREQRRHEDQEADERKGGCGTENGKGARQRRFEVGPGYPSLHDARVDLHVAIGRPVFEQSPPIGCHREGLQRDDTPHRSDAPLHPGYHALAAGNRDPDQALADPERQACRRIDPDRRDCRVIERDETPAGSNRVRDGKRDHLHRAVIAETS